MENVATYSEARSEYTKQLATFIVPPLVTWFQNLWRRNAGNKQQCLSLFQTECEEIPRWNQDRIRDEVRILIDRSGCDFMEELMTAVFIAHTKVLTAVRLSTRQKKLSITVPKLDHFVHRVFRETARVFWKAPFLFMESGNVIDRQKNVLQIEGLATEAITTAVRSMLPVKEILRDYMRDEEVEEIDESQVVSNEKVEEEEVVEEEVHTPVHIPEPVTPQPPPTPEPVISTQIPDTPQIPEPQETVEVLKVDTEHAVRFSDYDSVFDETRGAPTIEYAPKDSDLEEDLFDMPSDGVLSIDESSSAPMGNEDIEDLEAPQRVKAAAVTVPKDTIDDSEVEVLE